jgi:indolepyruvate ferredoxin oxidoreductase beta subunit
VPPEGSVPAEAEAVPGAAARARAIRVAVLAMGGEGGGVLADWIVDLAEHAGYRAQATSVPGVAQRTGATIYYLELFPPTAAGSNAPRPVMSLMPVPGDVDVVVASELMEAARAVQRGIVTPDRTTLVASTNRVYAITEKMALGDGRVDEAALLEACGIAAKTLVAFDMAAVAERSGSVISAALFGGLARSGALPFPVADFEATIERAGVGVKPSLAAFRHALEGGTAQAPPPRPSPAATDVAGVAAAAEELVPPDLRPTVRAGVERTADFQDLAYARLYLERLRPVLEIERRRGDGTWRLLREVARHLALGMAYEDTIRVAELKIRAARFRRVAEEVRLKDGQILEISEYLHPRLQEIAETLPAWLGRMLLRKGPARRLVEALTRGGRTVKTTSVRGFLLLYAVASMKPMRPRTLRWAAEQEHLEDWLAAVARTAERDYAAAVEVAECLNLVKGYGDTHERGRINYLRIMGLLPRLEGPEAARAVADLRQAALLDESGARLKEAIARLGVA